MRSPILGFFAAFAAGAAEISINVGGIEICLVCIPSGEFH
jgi:hypothetical protein